MQILSCVHHFILRSGVIVFAEVAFRCKQRTFLALLIEMQIKCNNNEEKFSLGRIKTTKFVDRLVKVDLFRRFTFELMES